MANVQIHRLLTFTRLGVPRDPMSIFIVIEEYYGMSTRFCFLWPSWSIHSLCWLGLKFFFAKTVVFRDLSVVSCLVLPFICTI